MAFFSGEVVKLSPDGMDNMGNIIWELALCLLLSWSIIFTVLLKGISSLGKVRLVFSWNICSVLHVMFPTQGITEGAGVKSVVC